MQLIVDSAVQLRYELIKELGLHVLEYPLFVNGEPYPAAIDMDMEAKEKLRGLVLDKNNKVTTAGLAERDVRQTYQSYGKEKIISFHQSFRMSSVTGNVIGRITDDLPESDITVFDSHNMASAYSVQVLEAARAIQEGMEPEAFMQLIETNRDNTRHLGVIFDLFFLHRTGRIGLIKAVLGRAIRIIPLIGSSDEPGILTSIGKARTSIQANQRFIRIMEDDMAAKNGKRLSVVITYFGPHKKEADHLRELIEAKGWDASIEVAYSNHSNVPHMGPDFYDMGYIVHTVA